MARCWYWACNVCCRPALVILLMSMVNEKQPFVLRCSVLYCFQCFLFKNEIGQSQLVQTLLPSSADGMKHFYIWAIYSHCVITRHKYWVIHKSVRHFKNLQQIDYAMDHGNSYANRERNFFLKKKTYSQMLNVSTFGNTADICAIVHLVQHACQHLLRATFAYYCLLAANRDNYVRGLFLKKLAEFLSLSALALLWSVV
jgi:hypothetical protein